MFNRSSLLAVVVITMAGIGLMPRTATAKPYWDCVWDNAKIVLKTAKGELTPEEEVKLINANWDEYEKQKADEGKAVIAAVAEDGVVPVSTYTTADLGTTRTLTYFFIDPVTDELAPAPFEVTAVRYEALLEPPTMIEANLTIPLIQAHLVVLGTSFDVGGDFAFDVVMEGFEPIFLGFPLNALGQDIEGEGTAGVVANVLIPEPAGLGLAGLALLGVRRRRRK